MPKTIVYPNQIRQEKQEAIASALRKVAASAPKKASCTNPDRIPYELAIPLISRRLIGMMPGKPQKPHPNKALADVSKASDRLLKALQRIPPVEESALQMTPECMRTLRLILETLSAPAQEGPKRRSGAPVKVRPAQIAKAVADEYWHLTGLKPTVRKREGKPSYGPFVELLAEIFEIMDVNASAASQAEQVVKGWTPP